MIGPVLVLTASSTWSLLLENCGSIAKLQAVVSVTEPISHVDHDRHISF